MSRLIWRWHNLSIGLLSIALVLTACSDGAGVTNRDTTAVSLTEPAAAVNARAVPVASSDGLSGSLSINVIVTDEGFQPPSIFIPAGRRVRLVLRNRGSTEHHFRVLELSPQDLLWQAPVQNAADSGEDEEAEHTHHQTGFVAFRAASPAGIRPMGDEVHAYAEAGGGDMVIFTVTDAGTFLVHCPLHPEITGKVTVYGNAGRPAALSSSESAPDEDMAQKSLKSAAVLRELIPLLTRTETSEDGIELEALYQAPVLFELTGRTLPELGAPVIAFTVSESVHDGELAVEVTEFVLTIDGKGPFTPLQVRQLIADPHHRITEYLFPGKDSDGSPLIKGGHQHLILSVGPKGTAVGWHLPISPSTPSSASNTVSLTDAQIIRVESDDRRFKPNRLTLTKGKRVVLVFQNAGSVEHHLHALTMPVEDILWFTPAQPGAPAPADLDALRNAQFLPYHACDSESGICPTGLDVHAHARAGDWLVISFIPSASGTYPMDCQLHPNMNGTIVVK